MALKVGELYGVLKLDKGQFDKGIKSSGSKFGSFSKLIVSGAALAATAIIGLGLAALKIAGNYKEGLNQIRIGTGATGDDLKEQIGRAHV